MRRRNQGFTFLEGKGEEKKEEVTQEEQPCNPRDITYTVDSVGECKAVALFAWATEATVHAVGAASDNGAGCIVIGKTSTGCMIAGEGQLSQPIATPTSTADADATNCQ